MARVYRDKQWVEYRESVFEMDGYACVKCGRSPPEVVLQVHHKFYERGKLPWDYPPNACETLCKGCHAREHGEIRPNDGWMLYAQDDLGGLNGECECCGTSIRHVFYIQHEKWEPMAVGTVCCDSLTGTSDATEHRKLLERKKRFISSKRWKLSPLGRRIKQGRFLEIEIQHKDGEYRIHMNGIGGLKTFNSELAAKELAFELIECGKAQTFAVKHPKRNKRNPNE